MSKNSPNQEMFSTAKVEYEDVLKKSDYDDDLKYTFFYKQQFFQLSLSVA